MSTVCRAAIAWLVIATLVRADDLDSFSIEAWADRFWAIDQLEAQKKESKKIFGWLQRASVDARIKELAVVTRRGAPPAIRFPSEKAKKERVQLWKNHIAECDRTLEELKQETAWPVPWLAPTPGANRLALIEDQRIGLLACDLRVKQVVSANEMLVDLVGIDSELLWFRGVPTAGYADNTRLSAPRLSLLWRVAGTHTYTTVAGAARTVFVVEPLSHRDLAKLIPEGHRAVLVLPEKPKPDDVPEVDFTVVVGSRKTTPPTK